MHAAVRAFPDVATVGALLAVADLADAALRAAHPALRRDAPPESTAHRREFALLRSIQRLRRDAARYLEHHEDLVAPGTSFLDDRQLDMF